MPYQKFFILFSIVLLLFAACKNSTDITEKEFNLLMNNIAKGWSTQNTDLALNSFDKDAIYLEPPNVQYFRGHDQLRPYFDELTDNHIMIFHNLWFNQKAQSGAGEFTFSYGKEIADTGIVVVEIENGKIKVWREYHKKGPSDFKEFISIEDKEWRWHIGNYPEPKDTILSNSK